MPEGSPATGVPSAIPTPEERLAEIRERKADRAAVRDEFARRRAYGLQRRHAQKLRNLTASAQQTTTEEADQ